MKKRFLFSTFSIFVLFSLLLSSSVFAEDSTKPADSNPVGKPVLVATVNIQNTKIVSQKGNVFEISFEMSNDKIIQNGVHYGVKLVSTVKGEQFLIDEKVYDESLYLPEHTIIRKTITYTAPEMLSGKYALILFGGNSSGLSLGFSVVKDITLTASKKGLEVVTDSCYLKVEGDKFNTHYGLLQNVDIKESESLRLTCNTINHTNDSLSMTPTYETRSYSPFGESVSTVGGDNTNIKFAPSKSEGFSVVLPKGTIPGLYNLKVSLDGAIPSNILSVQYQVQGVTASIKNASFDKDYYSRGDQAIVTVLLNTSNSADQFLRSSNLYTDIPKMSLEGELTNGDGGKCAPTFNQEVSSFKMDIPISIVSKCLNPHISLTVKDDQGKVLDQKEFSVTTINPPQKKSLNSTTLIVVILIVILLIIISMRKKKKDMKTVLSIFALFIFSAAILPFHNASAYTYMAGASGNIGVDVGLDFGTNYVQGDPFSVTGMITSPTFNIVDMRVIAANIFGQILPVQSVSGGSIFRTISLGSAPTALVGTFNADFKTGVDEEEIFPPGGYIGTVFAIGPHYHGSTYMRKVIYVGQATHPTLTVRVVGVGRATDPYEHTSNPLAPSSSDEIYVIPSSTGGTGTITQYAACSSNCGIPLSSYNYSVVRSVSGANVQSNYIPSVPRAYHVCQYPDAPGAAMYFSPATWVASGSNSQGASGTVTNSGDIQDNTCSSAYPDSVTIY